MDADNGAGAALDCGNDLIWKDDRVSVIPVLLSEWHKTLRSESRWVIQIAKL